MKTFEQLNTEGSEMFKRIWVTANSKGVDIANYYAPDLMKDHADEVKLLISALCLGLLKNILAPELWQIFHDAKSALWKAWQFWGNEKATKNDRVKFIEDEFARFDDKETYYGEMFGKRPEVKPDFTELEPLKKSETEMQE